MRKLLPALLAGFALGGCAQVPAQGTPLAIAREIALPNVKGRIDHMALDAPHHRLIVAEIANGSVDAIDLTGGRQRRIAGFARPQGVVYLAARNELVVACGSDGTVRFYNADTLAPAGSIRLGEDADNIRVDPASGMIAVGYGWGTIGLIDPARRAVVRQIALTAQAEFPHGARRRWSDCRHRFTSARAYVPA